MSVVRFQDDDMLDDNVFCCFASVESMLFKNYEILLVILVSKSRSTVTSHFPSIPMSRLTSRSPTIDRGMQNHNNTLASRRQTVTVKRYTGSDRFVILRIECAIRRNSTRNRQVETPDSYDSDQ